MKLTRAQIQDLIRANSYLESAAEKQRKKDILFHSIQMKQANEMVAQYIEESIKTIKIIVRENTGENMQIITIYFNPIEHPNKYVSRVFEYDQSVKNFMPTDQIEIKNTLEEIRETIPIDRYCFSRDENDDPVIIETWI